MRTSEWQRKFVVGVSVPLALLVSFASLKGIYTEDFYMHESSNWRVQAIGQDVINLIVITPFLLISALLTFFNRRAGLGMWCGTLLYLIYTFIIYCFSVHFNELFLVYCLVLGLSLYSFLYLLYKQAKERAPWFIKSVVLKKILAAYFLLVGLFFYGLWLKDIMDALLANTIPPSLVDSGLFTNPVHVLDISIVLPGVILMGILLFKGNHLGVLMTPIVLTFFILMDITIAVLTILLAQPEEGFGVSLVLFTLTILSILLLMAFFRKLSSEKIME